MVIVVPEGDSHDPTRIPECYDPAFALLKTAGIPNLNRQATAKSESAAKW